MEARKTATLIDRLNTRHGQLLITLRHLGQEQREVERNTDWLDQAAYESRAQLLDRLHRWYHTEMAQIERAFERVKSQRYGLCLACHAAIDPERLESAPEVEFCGACQAAREALASSTKTNQLTAEG